MSRVEPTTMNILCSGNPNHNTVASAIKKCFPSVDFASRATGYDLRFWDPGSETYFKEQIVKAEFENPFMKQPQVLNTPIQGAY